jgi:hypothetical protein
MTGASPTAASSETPGGAAAATLPEGVDAHRVGPVPARLLVRAHLTKVEVFEACQALAAADPVLVAAGRLDEARALGDLFELLEDRLTAPDHPVPATYDCSGRYSMDSELTQ